MQCFEINHLANGKPEPVIQMTKDGFTFLDAFRRASSPTATPEFRDKYAHAREMRAERPRCAPCPVLGHPKKSGPNGFVMLPKCFR